MSQPLFDEVVRSAWARGDGDVITYLDQVKTASMRFKKDTFENIFQRKRHIINRLNGIQKAMERVDSIWFINTEADLRKELDNILWQEVILWFQKSHEQWIRFGEGNTRFFHAQQWFVGRETKLKAFFYQMELGLLMF